MSNKGLFSFSISMTIISGSVEPDFSLMHEAIIKNIRLAIKVMQVFIKKLVYVFA